jgi:uncharacterized protein YicC (UPF0701 family)
LKKGIPTDKRFVDEFLTSTSQANSLLTSWLEDFKSKFYEYLDTEGKVTVEESEAALQLYKDVVVASKTKIDIQKAIDARADQGSVLEYGLDHHLERFVSNVSKIICTLLKCLVTLWNSYIERPC